MKEYVFNEQRDIEQMIECNYVDKDNLCRTIKKLARYNYYVLGLNDKDNYVSINNYMKKNSADYSEVGYYTSIGGCIRDISKSSWKNIDKIIITNQELETIRALNDDRKEKLAFVLLADAKYDNAYKDKNLNLSYLTLSDLYRFARVTMPVKERALFLHFLYENQLVEINLNPSKVFKKLTYVSEENNEVALELYEANYKELAFTYMNWKYSGYKACKVCDRLFKVKGNAQYCKNCTPKYEKIEFKTLYCIDCGKEVSVGTLNTKTCRCEECQSVIDKENKAERNRRYYEKHKN